jgi:hypothetical protein
LTDEQVREIFSSYKKFGPHRSNGPQLAMRYGVCDGAIYDIISGRRWKHLQLGQEKP